MKKALITIIIIGLALLVAGKIIMVISENNNNKMSINKEVLSSGNEEDTSVSDNNSNIINKEFEDVKNINLTLGLYSIVIQGDDTIKNVQITAKKPVVRVNGKDIDKLEINCKNGNLTIIQKQEKNKIGTNLFNFNDYKGELLIKVPNNNKLDKIDIENGVGKIEVKNISTDTLDIDCGTSSVVGNNLKMSNCYISGGTGSVKLYDILTDKIEIDSGTGSTYISGDIMKDANISTGTNSIELMLNGKEKDYNYNIETGIGGIEINQNKYKREANINNNSERNIEITSGTGSVDIKTK